MDLNTILTELRATPCQYRSVKLYEKDVRLTFNNCITYNGRGSEIGAYAGRLRVIFDRLFAEWVLPFVDHLVLGGTSSGCEWEAGLDDDRCQTCAREWEHRSDELLLCEGCDAAYHIFCLQPALGKVPTTDWCATCFCSLFFGNWLVSDGFRIVLDRFCHRCAKKKRSMKSFSGVGLEDKGDDGVA